MKTRCSFRYQSIRLELVVAILLAITCPAFPAPATEPAGWTTASPRDEIRPLFSYEATGGLSGAGCFVIEHDEREGLDGCWRKTVPIRGGRYYRFCVFRRVANVTAPRQSALVQVTWQDDKGRLVENDRPIVDFYRNGARSLARPEFPLDKDQHAGQWTEVRDIYRAPAKATRAVVALHLKWAPGGRIEWCDLSLTETEKPAPRTVRLATVHFRPQGGTSPADNCQMFAPLIAKAAKQRADLVVLPETLTYYGLGKGYADVAEPIPGPSTEYFGKLARQHDMYLVAGLLERDGHLIYNVAVLIDHQGKVAGKYRKVCLPRGEAEGGIAPGHEYPVFDTRFGKVGMMVCYDGFFPEVARELTIRGAEVIAWPVWGCNPLFARARASENHTYLISSTYTDISTNWIVSAVYDHSGETIALAKEWGDVVVAEVDLDARTQWSGIGDFKAEMQRRRPLRTHEGGVEE